MKSTLIKYGSVILVLGLQVLLNSGCSSGFTRPTTAAAPAFKASADKPISNVTAELTPEVKEKLKDSLKFDQKSLVEKVELALNNQKLFNKDKKDDVVELHIVVTHVRVRNTFNAVMWGAMAGSDSIEGDVILKNAAGTVIDQFHIDASYALGGWAGGQDSMRMNWLYEAFAKEVLGALTGETTKS